MQHSSSSAGQGHPSLHRQFGPPEAAGSAGKGHNAFTGSWSAASAQSCLLRASKWLQVTPGKASPRSCRKVCRTSASYNNNSGGVDIADRVVAALPFCIPLFDGLRYGGSPTRMRGHCSSVEACFRRQPGGFIFKQIRMRRSCTNMPESLCYESIELEGS